VVRAHLTLLLVAAIGCRGDGPPPAAPKDQPPPPCAVHSRGHHPGDRVGTHGMVVFGRRGSYLLEHLPMYTTPHDEQLVIRASIRTAEGARLDADFSDQGYSVKPTSAFSLNDLLLRKLTSFGADVHRGNFEEDGPVIHPGVTVTVDAILLSRSLPAADESSPAYYVVVDGTGVAYATNAIRDGRGILEIFRLGSFTRQVPAGCALELTQAEAGDVVGAAGATRLWCLRAPDFVDPCEP